MHFQLKRAGLFARALPTKFPHHDEDSGKNLLHQQRH